MPRIESGHLGDLIRFRADMFTIHRSWPNLSVDGTLSPRQEIPHTLKSILTRGLDEQDPDRQLTYSVVTPSAGRIRRNIAGRAESSRVESSQEVFEIAWVLWGRLKNVSVFTGRVRSGRLGSDRVESDRFGSGHPYPTQSARKYMTRPVKF